MRNSSLYLVIPLGERVGCNTKTLTISIIMRKSCRIILLLTVWSPAAVSFVLQNRRTTLRQLSTKKGSEEDALPIPTKDIVRKVAVTGATGRTGSWVVRELLNRQVSVVAMVRSADKAKETFSDESKNNPLLEIIPCDLTKKSQIQEAVKGCDAAIWCATGFSDAPTSLVERIQRLLGIALAPKQSIDFVGVPLLAKVMLNQVVGGKQNNSLPKVIMLSSAGVTRPSWDEAKKDKYRGSADIPIVRLNPFGILDVKAESEEKLRKSGAYVY